MALTKEGQLLLDALRDSPERLAILRELYRLRPGKKRGRKRNPWQICTDVEAYHYVQKALLQTGSIRDAAKLVQEECGINRHTAKRLYLKVRSKISQEDREDYRKSLDQ